MKKALLTIFSVALIMGMYGCSPNPNTQQTPKEAFQTQTHTISLEDTFINQKPILNITYEDIVKDLGEPKEVRYFKVTPPACEEFQHFAVTVFDNIEVEFDLGFGSNKSTIEQSKSIRYDITGSKYSIQNVHVGMNIEDLQGIEITDISEDNPNAYHILTSYKTDDYYSDYEKMAYLGGTVTEDECEKYGWNGTTCIGYTVLLKDNRVSRLVFGYPTAD